MGSRRRVCHGLTHIRPPHRRGPHQTTQKSTAATGDEDPQQAPSTEPGVSQEQGVRPKGRAQSSRTITAALQSEASFSVTDSSVRGFGGKPELMIKPCPDSTCPLATTNRRRSATVRPADKRASALCPEGSLSCTLVTSAAAESPENSLSWLRKRHAKQSGGSQRGGQIERRLQI